MSGRFVVVGLARVRASWFAEVSSWANAGRVPIDFVKCVSSAEVLVRLDDVRGASAVIVEAGAAGVDRDLIDTARGRGIPTVVIGTADDETDWCALGAAAVLPRSFDDDALMDLLHAVAQPISTAPVVDATDRATTPDAAPNAAPLVAVLGVNGSGTSTVAIALAQGLAGGDDDRSVVLADLVRRGDQAMYHDARDIVPGFQELVEAHRGATPDAERIGELLFGVDRRGYALLLGLRRLRDWTALRPRAIEAALDSLRAQFDVVVADLDHEVDGEAETGSADLEDRNAATRIALREAAAVVVTADASLRGLHQLLHIQRDLLDFGVDPARIVTVINRAPRSPRQRAEISAGLAALSLAPTALSPVFVAERRNLDLVHSTGDPIPASLVRPLLGALRAVLDQCVAPSAIDTASAATTATVSPR
ncbi:MAG: hypothetical protein GX868_02460 [Actinobacteria bacterium]|nr:hypothetical protein [Actinomycetota bacterium]